MTPFEKFKELFTGIKPIGNTGKQFSCLCPAHNDNKQSLGVGVKDNGQLMLHCYAGCSVSEIVSAVGLTMKDLFPDDRGASL